MPSSPLKLEISLGRFGAWCCFPAGPKLVRFDRLVHGNRHVAGQGVQCGRQPLRRRIQQEHDFADQIFLRRQIRELLNFRDGNDPAFHDAGAKLKCGYVLRNFSQRFGQSHRVSRVRDGIRPREVLQQALRRCASPGTLRQGILHHLVFAAGRLHGAAQLGVVLQETFLFDGSIRENVLFSRPGATEEQWRQACVVARVDEFAERLPERYETIIGERGVKLSGGQRQRISIARAILANPRLLILDEATSSLDSESEALIQSGLTSLMQDRTTFVIAHRLSTIRRADQILVVEQGRVVECGSHASLYKLGGRYHDLYTRQYELDRNLFLAPGEGDEITPAELAV